MSEPTVFDSAQDPTVILRTAAQRPLPPGGAYAGAVTPVEAHGLHRSGAARIVDVRTAEELEYVGRVPGALHVAWRARGAAAPNPHFVEQLKAVAHPEETLLLLCRSAQRSHWAAIAATAAGFRAVYNILEGFEGDLDANGQRGRLGGWRLHGLPWVQG